MLHVQIAGIGHYLPERVVTSAELEQAWGLAPGWAERVAGVRARHVAAGGETTAAMAAIAGRRALADAGVELGAIDLIIAAAAGPQQTIPCTAAYIQRALGAPEGASACFDVDATCLSFLFALQTAAHLVAAGSYRVALIVSSEIASRSINPAEPASAILFGDAAVAAVVTRAPADSPSAIVWEQFATFSSGADYTRIRGGGTLHHPNDPATTAEMNLFQMDGPAVYRQAIHALGPFIDRFLARAGWRRDQVDALVPHQASGHAMELLVRRLGFTRDQLVVNLPERGNCVAASIPLALSEAVAAGRVRRGQRVMLLGSGAGMTLGAAGLIY